MKFQAASDVAANALFSRDASYFDMFDDFDQGERVDAVDPYMHGMLAAIGVAEGKLFSLTAAASVTPEVSVRPRWPAEPRKLGEHERSGAR